MQRSSGALIPKARAEPLATAERERPERPTPTDALIATPDDVAVAAPALVLALVLALVATGLVTGGALSDVQGGGGIDAPSP